jgi:two-component system LytT family response regulator
MRSFESREPLRVIVVDDESMARARLRRLLSETDDVEVIAECANGEEAIEAIVNLEPEVVFLDIHMPGLNGFQVLESLPAMSLPNFVFVTAHDRYALRAFSVNALDYLLKPFDADRLRQTLRRARERQFSVEDRRALLAALHDLVRTQGEQQPPPAAGVAQRGTDSPSKPFADRIAVKRDGRIILVRTTDIDYVESASNYVCLHVGTQSHLVRETMNQLAAGLDPALFARIHRTTIVNIDRIKEIQPWFSGDAVIILHAGQRLRLSRHYRDSLQLERRATRAKRTDAAKPR